MGYTIRVMFHCVAYESHDLAKLRCQQWGRTYCVNFHTFYGVLVLSISLRGYFNKSIIIKSRKKYTRKYSLVKSNTELKTKIYLFNLRLEIFQQIQFCKYLENALFLWQTITSKLVNISQRDCDHSMRCFSWIVLG